MKANYHTHTTRCGHAYGTDESYVRAAIQGGFETLAFTDRSPWPYKSGFTNPNVRMNIRQLDGYLEKIRRLSEKYRDKIRLYVGLECEYFPEYMNWLAETKEEKQLDLLVFGNHYDKTDETGMHFGFTHDAKELRLYVDSAIAGMRTGLFAYMAHPDFFLRGFDSFNADCRAASCELCLAAKELSVPLEYNLHERANAKRLYRRVSYPSAEFFEIAYLTGNEVIIGLDAHDPDELSDSTQWDRACAELEVFGERWIRKLNLQNNAG